MPEMQIDCARTLRSRTPFRSPRKNGVSRVDENLPEMSFWNLGCLLPMSNNTSDSVLSLAINFTRPNVFVAVGYFYGIDVCCSELVYRGTVHQIHCTYGTLHCHLRNFDYKMSRLEDRNELIRLLFGNGFKQKDICSTLSSFGCIISERHLRRLLRQMGLRRRSEDRPLQEVRDAVRSELRHWSPDQGIRAMLQRVRDVRGVRPCYRDDIADAMRQLDPSGLQRRYPGRRKIHRRNYYSRGPNDTWHIDGNDKMKFFGLWLHLCIDGFSRRLIWLKVGTSNRKQRFVARYFYDAVVDEGGCPKMIRSDRGQENRLIGQMQIAFHIRQLGNEARKSFRVGKSVHNQRAESFNSMLKRTWIRKWLARLEGMTGAGSLELDNPIHINCLQYTHLPKLQEELDLERRLWNAHPIRKQRHAPGPFGKPDVLYTAPPPGFVNMMCPVEPDMLQHSKDLVSARSEQLLVANPEFRRICDAILVNKGYPASVEGCLAAYLNLVEELSLWMTRNNVPTPATFAQANEIYRNILLDNFV